MIMVWLVVFQRMMFLLKRWLLPKAVPKSSVHRDAQLLDDLVEIWRSYGVRSLEVRLEIGERLNKESTA